jgi:hypothetical protein
VERTVNLLVGRSVRPAVREVIGLEEVGQELFEVVAALLALGLRTGLGDQQVEELGSQGAESFLTLLPSTLLLIGLGATAFAVGLIGIHEDAERGRSSFELDERSASLLLIRRIRVRAIHVAELFNDLALDRLAVRAEALEVVEYKPGNLRLAVLERVITVVQPGRHTSADKERPDVISVVESVSADLHDSSAHRFG